MSIMNKKYETVNPSVRICIKCGSVNVKIDSNGIYCAKCNSHFQRAKYVLRGVSWAQISVLVFANTIKQTHHLEKRIHQFTKNGVRFVMSTSFQNTIDVHVVIMH